MLTETLENILNRGLPRSFRAQALCAELTGRKLQVTVAQVAHLLIESTGQTLRVRAVEADSAADATLEGGPVSLLGLLGESPEARLQRGDVRITGDADVAAKFRELALLLRPDPEEELSLLLGDVPAHQIGRLVRTAIGWTRHAADTAVVNFAEYLGHEARDLVPRAEADVFLRGVDDLREDVDRIAARLDLLTP